MKKVAVKFCECGIVEPWLKSISHDFYFFKTKEGTEGTGRDTKWRRAAKDGEERKGVGS